MRLLAECDTLQRNKVCPELGMDRIIGSVLSIFVLVVFLVGTWGVAAQLGELGEFIWTVGWVIAFYKIAVAWRTKP